MAIFSDMIGQNMDVFMDNFSVFGDSFDEFLQNLGIVLKRCIETNLVLNWEKCHFMELELEIKDKKVTDNQVVDHLSRLEYPSVISQDKTLINESFPDEQLFRVKEEELWFRDIMN
ncbi:uncharacterized protein LOC141680076 [Apium graveolens]|uniref:uncharacterized protein LOC141680076 n=1 Tax=Apium graveolens TaxID=4045 RepID=UPI003D7A3DD8